jgi:hypothetical protein
MGTIWWTDLLHAPEVFTTSTRIRAQNGCLIAADPQDSSGGDLSQFLAHVPILVGWPMSGCPTVNLPVNQLFPCAEDDEWYARLLFLPVIHQISREELYWQMSHPIPVSLYLEHSKISMYAVEFRPLQPPLLHPWLIFPALIATSSSDAISVRRASAFLRTIPVLLEAPILALQPEADGKSWNQELLVNSLPLAIGVIDLVSGEFAGRSELLTDVLFELPPLECVGWTDLLRDRAELRVPLRAGSTGE